MKYIKSNYKFFSLSILFILSINAFGQAELDKVFEWKSNTHHDVKLQLSTFDSDVIVKSHQGNTIKFGYIVGAKAKEKGQIDKLSNYLSKLDINLSGNEIDIDAKFWDEITVNGKGDKKSIVLKLKNGETLNLKHFEVTTLLEIPYTARFTLKSKYCDVVLPDLKYMSLTSFDDDITGKSVKNAMRISAKYSDLLFSQLGNTSITLFDCDFTAGSTENLSIESKYSDVEIAKSSNTSINSFDDDYVFGTMQNLSFNGKYSDIEADQLLNLSASAFDCDMEIEELQNVSFDEIKYADIEFGNLQSLTISKAFDVDIELGSIENVTIGELKNSSLDIDYLSNQLSLKGFDNSIEINEIANNCRNITIDQKYGNLEIQINSGQNVKLIADLKYGKIDFELDNIEFFKNEKNNENSEIEAIIGSKGDKITELNLSGNSLNISLEQD